MGTRSRTLASLYMDRESFSQHSPKRPSILLKRTEATFGTLVSPVSPRTIPHSIGSLSNLKELSMFNNSFHGQILESVFNLSMLQILAFSANSISGNLPSSIANGLPNLDGRYLADNRLSGEIPAYVSNFSKLTILDLSKNSFSGRVPMNLGNLQNLETLVLEYNELTNDPSMLELDFLISLTNCIIPNESGNMSNLIELGIEGNELTGTIPDTLGQLRKLQKLRLGFNKLGRSLEKLENLEYFNVSFNELSGEIPNGGPFNNFT
ncbi:probable LRR receptor-like serine threonine-kinase At3g47570 [Olea europaea subsp. europaea]|uniref:Probable LRR receptor-like serine threonine-kinase At3g47570 n=1 Tax=Olea europaea subsp. europaea TaxID=158383 RepID=A0A8S0T4E0_OLEEU|nr:probable LRR receptor-like serine threonine-kinase At3g47570 [Olea europaea subsp. europaea]